MPAPIDEILEVAVIGGGPAGLSAALILGRCRRRVLLCDDGRPRNAAAQATHGFFTRDGTAPAELRRLGREQLAPYGVEVLDARVVDIESGDYFRLQLEGGIWRRARKVLLATGIEDPLPAIEGMAELYGTSVFHCPYCDGWEQRDRALALLGRGSEAASAALGLTTWSADVVLCTDGGRRFSPAVRQQLNAAGIRIRSERVLRLEGEAGQLQRIVFARGEPLARQALFFHNGVRQRSSLAARLGAQFTSKGEVKTGRLQDTCVPGLYVAGDAAFDVKLIAIAVAEGVKAAFSINRDLRAEATGNLPEE